LNEEKWGSREKDAESGTNQVLGKGGEASHRKNFSALQVHSNRDEMSFWIARRSNRKVKKKKVPKGMNLGRVRTILKDGAAHGKDFLRSGNQPLESGRGEKKLLKSGGLYQLRARARSKGTRRFSKETSALERKQ